MTTTTHNDMPRVDLPLDVVVPDTPESLVAPKRRGPGQREPQRRGQRTWLVAVLSVAAFAVLIAIAAILLGGERSLDVPTAGEEAASLQAEKQQLLAHFSEVTPMSTRDEAALQAEKEQLVARANDTTPVPTTDQATRTLRAEKDQILARTADAGNEVPTTAQAARVLRAEKDQILARTVHGDDLAGATDAGTLQDEKVTLLER